MARPGFKSYPHAKALSARPATRLLLAIDALANLGLAGLLARAGVQGNLGPGAGFGLAAAALLAAFASIGSIGMRPRARNARMTLCLVAWIAAVWRGGPLDGAVAGTLALVVWNGLVWIVLLVEGRRISAAIAEATGEEGLGDDPSRHL